MFPFSSLSKFFEHSGSADVSVLSGPWLGCEPGGRSATAETVAAEGNIMASANGPTEDPSNFWIRQSSVSAFTLAWTHPSSNMNLCYIVMQFAGKLL